MLSDSISYVGSDSPGRYPTRTTRNANPSYRPMRGFHAALTSIMRTEACRMAGVCPENITSPEANHGISSYFSYATMMHTTPPSLPDGVFNDTMATVAHKVMLHMALKRGLKEYGIRGEEAVSTELMQIHMQNTFKPQHYADLTQVQRRKALESLLFLEENRTGAIKGRMCADGSKQRPDF